MLEIDVDPLIDEGSISIRLMMYDKDFLKSDDFIGQIESPLCNALQEGTDLAHTTASGASKAKVEKCKVFWSAVYVKVVTPEFSRPDPSSPVPVVALELTSHDERRTAVGYEDGCVYVFVQKERDVVPVLRVDTQIPGLSCLTVGTLHGSMIIGGDSPTGFLFDLSWRRCAKFKLHDGCIDAIATFSSGLVIVATHANKRHTTAISLWE